MFERPEAGRLKVVPRGDVVLVTIPVTYTVRELRRRLGPALMHYLKKASRADRGRYAATGLVRYGEIARYARLLEVDLAHRAKPMWRKLELLKERYEKETSRLQKQNATIKNRGLVIGRKRVRKFRTPKRFKNDVRLGYEWRRKGGVIVENVARGVFPGRAYRKGVPER